MRRITLATFRRLDSAEEAMIRSVMPRTSAASPEPLARRAEPVGNVVASRSGSRLVARPLTATLAEVANA